MPSLFDTAYAIVLLALLVAYLRLQSATRREARRTDHLRGRVVSIERKESGRRAQPWIVVTTYAVVGHGLLGHHRWFADESQARIWERRHPVDSVHDVILDPRAKGSAYVPEDLAGIGNEWYWWPIAAVTVAIAAYGIYLMVQPVMLE